MNDIKIIEEKENPLFKRKEIKGTIEAEAVPSRAETLEILSKKFETPLENIKIKGITGKFGSRTFDIKANIYSSEQDKDSVEIKKKKEKTSEKKEEPAQEEQPEVQTPQEIPQEQKPEVKENA